MTSIITYEKFSKEKHFSFIKECWKAYYNDDFPIDCMPENGIVALQDGEPIGSIFIYISDSKLAIMGYAMIVDKIEVREKLVILQQLVDIAKKLCEEELGITVILGMTGNNSVGAAMMRSGFIDNGDIKTFIYSVGGADIEFLKQEKKMNPMQNAPMTQGAPAAPAGMPPSPAAGGAMPQESRGAQRVSNTEFNQQIQNVILSRIQEEMEKNPEWGDALERLLKPIKIDTPEAPRDTPEIINLKNQAAAELGLIIPELIPIMRMDGWLGDAGQSAPSITASSPKPMSNSYGGAEESDNPILRDGLSSGLVG